MRTRNNVISQRLLKYSWPVRTGQVYLPVCIIKDLFDVYDIRDMTWKNGETPKLCAGTVELPSDNGAHISPVVHFTTL